MGHDPVTELPPADPPEMDARTPLVLSHLKAGLVVFFTLATLSAVYGAAWIWLANQFDKRLDLWVQEQQASGLMVSYEMRSRNGFPGSMQIKLRGLRLIRQGLAGQNWLAEQAKLSLKPWAPGRLNFDISGRHQWHFKTNGGEKTMQATAADWQGTIDLRRDFASSLASHVRDLKITEGATGEPLQLAQGELSLVDLQSENPGFRVRLRNLELPTNLDAPLGEQVRHFDAKGQLKGRIGTGQWPHALALWRDNGGTFEVDTFDLDYPPLRLRGDGTLALDGAMQPVAALSVKAEGFFATVDALYARGFIPLGTSFATKIALGVLSVNPKNGENAYLDLPISLQEQTLYVGSIELLKLRPIRW